MRLSATSRAPADVGRYLLPREIPIITVRQHPAVLTLPLAAALGGLLAAIAVSQIPHIVEPAQLAVWILTAFLNARLILAVLNWMGYYVVVTKDRLLVLSGVFNRTVVVIRLLDLENMTFERSFDRPYYRARLPDHRAWRGTTNGYRLRSLPRTTLPGNPRYYQCRNF